MGGKGVNGLLRDRDGGKCSNRRMDSGTGFLRFRGAEEDGAIISGGGLGQGSTPVPIGVLATGRTYQFRPSTERRSCSTQRLAACRGGSSGGGHSLKGAARFRFPGSSRCSGGDLGQRQAEGERATGRLPVSGLHVRKGRRASVQQQEDGVSATVRLPLTGFNVRHGIGILSRSTTRARVSNLSYPFISLMCLRIFHILPYDKVLRCVEYWRTCTWRRNRM